MRTIHTLVGLLVAAVAVPAACSTNPKGCEASRTCPSQGGEGSGSGGEAGEKTETGGSSGSSSGTSGVAGMDDGGGGGTGGSGGQGASGGEGASGGDGGADDGPPTVEAFTPGHGSSDVERDIEVTAELSEPIDEATVTEASVRLTGPDGDVAGTLSVDENVISFVPDRPLYLLGTYAFTLDDTLADPDGNTLEGPASAEFRVRDGRWSEPVYPFGEFERRVTTRLQRNALGDVVVGTEVWPVYEEILAGVYRAAENRWTTGEVPDSIGEVTGLGIDAQARAAVAWAGTTVSGWSEFAEATGFSPLGSLDATPLGVAVTPEGQALTMHWDGVSGYVTRVQSLGGGSLGPVEEFPLDGSPPTQIVTSLERFAAVIMRPVTGGTELAVSWRGSAGWGALEPLAFAPSIHTFRGESDEAGNIIVAWADDVGDVWSRVYERAEDAWTQPAFVVSVSPYDAILGSVDMTAGSAILSVSGFDPAPVVTLVAVYLDGTGWDEDSVVTFDEPALCASVAVAIDPRGNALAACYSDLKYRRYVPGTGWSAISPVGANVMPYNKWAAGASDGSVLVVSTDTDDEGENRYPFAVRFE